MKSEKPSYTRGPQAAGTQNTQHIHFSITLQDLPSSREKVVCCFEGNAAFLMPFDENNQNTDDHTPWVWICLRWLHINTYYYPLEM